MKILTNASLVLIALASCTTATTKFNDMTPAELMAYNRTVEFPDKVYCSESVSLGSHIRRQECVTYKDLAEGRVRRLNTPSSSSSTNN